MEILIETGAIWIVATIAVAVVVGIVVGALGRGEGRVKNSDDLPYSWELDRDRKR